MNALLETKKSQKGEIKERDKVSKKGKKLIYVVGGRCYHNYVNWILPLGFEIIGNPDKSDIIFFAGGEDLNPRLYGEPCGSRTGYNDYRDEEELAIFNKYIGRKKFIGVCRGCEALPIFTFPNQAKMIQHSGHPYMHPIKTKDNQIFLSNSLHHQQNLLIKEITGLEEGVDYILEAFAENLSPIHLDGYNKDYNLGPDYREVEIAWIPKSQSLVYQMHPEMMFSQPQFREEIEYFQSLISKYLL